MVKTMRRSPLSSRSRGFTLIELVIVMAMLGLLLSLALPHYMATLERGREQVLQKNIATMREALDKFYGDRGRYPERLEELVTARYLRAIPDDPFTESPTWVVIAPKDLAMGGVIDVQSTFTDSHGDPRLPVAPAAGAGDTLPNFVMRERGGSQIVNVAAAAAAASAPGVGADR
jgi:general secretion pathway protein G